MLAISEDFATGSLQDVKDRVRARMRAFGRKEGMPANEGNQNKKIRIETRMSDGELRDRLLAIPADSARTSDDQASGDTGKSGLLSVPTGSFSASTAVWTLSRSMARTLAAPVSRFIITAPM